jgi:hypothetical protein
MIDVLQIIKEIVADKVERKVNPTSALFSEVVNKVNEKAKAEINQLVIDKKLVFHRTINSISFDVVEEKEEK